MPKPTSKDTDSAVPSNPRADSVVLLGLVRAAMTANLQIENEMPAVVADLIRHSVDDLLEAAEFMAKRLTRALDYAEGGD